MTFKKRNDNIECMEKNIYNETQRIDEFQRKIEDAISRGDLYIKEVGDVAEFLKNNGGPGPGDTLMYWSREILKRLEGKGLIKGGE